MKLLVAMTLTVFSLTSWANHHEEMEKKMDSMSFEDAKKMKMEMLEKKSTMLEEQKKCVSASTDKEGLKQCWKEMHESKKDMKHEMMNKMKKKK